jgi:hypothetical protein
MMKIYIDGQEVEALNDVRISDDIVYGMDEDGNDLEGHVQVVLTAEGVIVDVFDEDGDVIGTSSQTFGELADSLI